MGEGFDGASPTQNDAMRLDALRSYQILYTEAEREFDVITEMMTNVFNMPMAFISLVDKDHVFYKSQAGPFGKHQVSRQDSLCSYTILNSKPLVIPDTLNETFLAENKLVNGPGGLRFYAGAPIVTKDGYIIGSVCLADTQPREFSIAQTTLLNQFAEMVMRQFELRQIEKTENAQKEKIKAYNQELQLVTDTMPQLVWAKSKDGYTFFLNRRWLEYTGLTLEQLEGYGWMECLHPDDVYIVQKAWQKAMHAGDDYEAEYRLKRHDGIYRWFAARGQSMKDTDGNAIRWYGTSTDIHQQKNIQEELRRTHERFELVSKATQDVIWDWNLVTNEVWWNDGFKTVFNYEEDDIEKDATSWYGRIHPDDKDRVVSGIYAAIEHEIKQWSDEYRFRKKDGTYAIVFDRGYAVYNQEGKPYRMLGSMQDITERKIQQEKLIESEHRFQAAIAAVQGILWTNDKDGKMVGEQPGWHQLTGQHYDEYKNFGWASVVHPDDAQPTVEAWNEAVAERKTFVFEHRLKTKNGHLRNFAIRAIPVFNTDGSIKEWVGVHTDITEQRLAEEKIRQSENRFYNLVKESPVGIIELMGVDMIVSIVNEAYCKLIGHTVNDLQDQPIFNVIPEAASVFKPIIEKVRTTGQPVYLYDQPYVIKAPENDVEGFLNIVYQPYAETGNNVTGVMVLCQDVTGQVLARKKIKEAEEAAKLAIDSANLGTFNVDMVTNQMISSKRLDEIFDVHQNSDRDRYIKAVHPADLAVRAKAYDKAEQSGVLEYEARVIKKDGIIRWIQVKGQMFFDEDRNPTKIVGVVQDITEEKEFAEELTRQVNERTLEMEQFTYVSHHDLQEPLRKIIIFSDMLRSEGYASLSELSKVRLDKIITSASRMSTALKDVLSFASLSKKDAFTDVDLNEVLKAVQEDLELAIYDKNATVHIPKLPVIKAVPQQMHQLFYNLLNNALKFAHQNVDANIEISCIKLKPLDAAFYEGLHADKTYYEIKIKDNGIGFNQQAAEKIFILFQRLHSKDKYPGTGIGLALCKKVVSNHNGQIMAESKDGEGAIFTVILPKP